MRVWRIEPRQAGAGTRPVSQRPLLATAIVAALLLATAAQAAVSVSVQGVNWTASPITYTGITNFRWTIEEDRTYHVVPGVPDANTLSVSFHPSYMPVVAQGDNANLAAALAALDGTKHYYITIIPTEPGTWAIGGAQIAPADITGSRTVRVYMNDLPLPTAQITVFVFEDNLPLNGAPDLPQEDPATQPCPGNHCMEGFAITLEDAGGRYGISAGTEIKDAFDNPLGTEYVFTDSNLNGVHDPGEPYSMGPDGPIVQTMGNGIIETGPDGIVRVRHLAPGKYGIIINPPAGRGWQQTSTIEGTKVIDAWVKANEPSYFQEFGPPGPHVFVGFTRPHSGTVDGVNYLTGGTTISGRVVNLHMSRPPDYAFYNGAPFEHTTPWVALNVGAAGTGQTVWARPTTDGDFSIPNVPSGSYSLTVFDDNLDLIISTLAVNVVNNDCNGLGGCNLGEIPVFDWFTSVHHEVFYDTDGDGFRDPDEEGIPDQNVNMRWRDGTVNQAAPTDTEGFVPFDEMFPFFAWQIAEVDYLRFKPTGVTVTVDAGGAINPTDPWSFEGKLNPQLQCNPGGFDPLTETCLGGDLINDNTGDNKTRTETGPVLLEAFQGFLNQQTVMQWGKQAYGPTENGGISGVVYYSTTRAENDPAFGFAEPWEPGIPRVQVNLYQDSNEDGEIDDINAPAGIQLADADNAPFGWSEGGLQGAEDIERNGAPGFQLGDALEIAHTDSWDDNLPTACQGEVFMFDADGPSGPLAPAAKDCFDGLRNFNQVREGVFDGGYAFGPAAGGDPMAPGVYIVEAVPPAGYEIVKEQDKNVDFGEEYFPSEMALPQACVNRGDVDGDGFPGQTLPAALDLFPGVPIADTLADLDPAAGVQRWLCDRKQVRLSNGQNAAADFFLFTRAPIAAHAYGFILDDTSNEFDPNSPNFGEKYAPPFLPISVRDWTGREVGRTYSDQYGVYNVLLPSTYTANQPKPSGMVPNMVTVCLNSPRKPDPDNPGQFIADEFHNPQYSEFCYTFQYMPGTTTYLDTPVVPVAAFAGPDQFPLDCEFVDGTPKIKRVDGPVADSGPYVDVSGGAQQITITAEGTVSVPNPAYDGSNSKTITRDYGFGGTEGQVWLGATQIAPANVTWAADGSSILATIPTTAQTGQLRIVRGDNGNETVVGLTLTVETTANVNQRLPVVRVRKGLLADAPPVYSTIQKAIDAAVPGSLVLVEPGVYEELVVMWKPVRLQGYGPAVTTIDAVKVPAEKLQQWRDKVRTLQEAGAFNLLPSQEANFAGLEPDALFNEQGPGVIVLALDRNVNQGGFGLENNPRQNQRNARIDGLTITGADHAGGIMVNGYARFMEIGNNRIIGNHGVYGGGIRVGHPTLTTLAQTAYEDAENNDVYIHDNHITQNGSTDGAGGGVALCTGSTGYRVVGNYVCGNFTMGDGAGIGHLGRSNGGQIAYNTIIFNESFNQGVTVNGGGIAVLGAPGLLGVAGGLTEGAGSVDILGNLIQGNAAGAGDGGGIHLDRVNGQDVPGSINGWYTVDMVNNIVADNVAALAGGGISLHDTLIPNIIHNTVALNDSTATAGEAFPFGNQEESLPQVAGIVSRAHSPGLETAIGPAASRDAYRLFSRPFLRNSIVWHNRSFYFTTEGFDATDPLPYGLVAATPAYQDLGVIGVVGQLDPRFCTLTSTAGYHSSNESGDPLFVAEFFNGDRGQTIVTPDVATPIAAPAAFAEGGNFIRVRFGPLTLIRPDTLVPYTNYHLRDGSPAEASGQFLNNAFGTFPDRNIDFDLEPRPQPPGNQNTTRPDIGADERT